jgi:hypothetical protein
MPAMAGEAYLAPGQGDVEARKKVDQIEGRCASESRTSEAVSLMLGVNRPSAFFRLTESNPALDRPMRQQAVNVALRTCVLVFERALQPAGVR